MMPYFLRHYSMFAERIIAFDEQSTDGTREQILKCSRAALKEWPHKGLDDEAFLHAINSEYKQARGHADWVMWADVDELLYHPRILDVMANAKEDAIASTGYALISCAGVPASGKDTDLQIYNWVPTGVRQPNYDKVICWRPTVEMVHTIGRHTYPSQYPKCSGTLGKEPKLKLLHCHHVGGVEGTAKINQRNYERANNKKYAWNYTAEHNKPSQVGSVAWVQDAIANNKLVDVITLPDYHIGTMALKKLNFGCGGFKLPGWENYDSEVDISKPLPFPDGSASHIFAEHVVEHITHRQAWNFFEDCRRVLAPGGIVRIAIPDIVRIQSRMTDEYREAVQRGGHGDGSAKAAVRAAIFEHGHQAVWTGPMLATFLSAVGFHVAYLAGNVGESKHPELRGIEQHWKTVGEAVARVETSIVEGTKP